MARKGTPKKILRKYEKFGTVEGLRGRFETLLGIYSRLYRHYNVVVVEGRTVYRKKMFLIRSLLYENNKKKAIMCEEIEEEKEKQRMLDELFRLENQEEKDGEKIDIPILQLCLPPVNPAVRGLPVVPSNRKDVHGLHKALRTLYKRTSKLEDIASRAFYNLQELFAVVEDMIQWLVQQKQKKKQQHREKKKEDEKQLFFETEELRSCYRTPYPDPRSWFMISRFSKYYISKGKKKIKKKKLQKKRKS